MREFEVTADKMRRADNKIIWAQSLATWNLSGFLQNLVIAAILTVVGYQFLAGQDGVTAGKLFVYVNYIEGVFILWERWFNSSQICFARLKQVSV